ncbi:hypothetical protein KBTX_02711 [wastewater metagenome]|uniref:JmjC domain-containing protein n=4 Tax=root TaxID=1 RepID=A0A5B8RCL0_9ZZZZ|nr:cupin domain-containing protein [Arhodomonas aquaeolei]QEA06376.1 hypothetical protein KBTEX_02711 [uncultured organism]
MAGLFGDIDTATFLAEYWQQRPLVVRGAFPEQPASITPEELAGLATEPDVESRVVIGETAQEDWMLLHGPFEPAFFSDTPDDDWTLLVQDVDKHLPAFTDWLAPFRFLPQWRIDDLMVSYAAPGGTVGPHLDRYDVFLVQGQGHRRWRLQWPAPEAERLRGHPDLRLLADFETTDEWVLGPGDMLYVPPGVPHYGIAEDDCITYSVGFRAPSGAELLAQWARERGEDPRDPGRYRDPEGFDAARGRLPAEALAQLRRLMREAASAPDAVLDDWLARNLTRPKSAFAEIGGGEEDDATLAARLDAGATLRLNPAARLLCAETADGPCYYLQGEPVQPPGGADALWARLAAREPVEASSLPDGETARTGALALLGEWRRAGHLLFDDEFEDSMDDD